MRTIHRSGVQASTKLALSAALFAGTAGLALAPGAALAADAAPAATIAASDASDAVSEVVVTGHKDKLESPKYTAPLVDTPQTITVVPAGVIAAQNLLTLRDILSTVPGITFGAGEGGGGYGDSINLRGYSASSDITVDGVRDSAQYTRSDPFNLEQLEVTNGANGAVAGSGSVGGSINIVSKQPLGRDVTTASLGLGTDGYGRAAIDSNEALGESVAVRLNAMIHQNDVPGRDVETFKRWGFAPSVSMGIGTPTTLTLSYFHQTDDNVPQYGVPYYNGRPVRTVPSTAYYGYANVDTQQSDVDALTARIDHRFSDTLSVRNLARYQVVDQYAVVNPPQGVFCLADGTKPVGISATNLTGYTACLPADPAPGFYQPSGPRGTLRDSRNTSLYNQTDFSLSLNTGGLEHRITAGFALLSETFRLDTGNIQRNAGGATPNPVYPPMDIANPNNIYAGPQNYVRASIQYGERRNQAIYVFDTIEISPMFQINGGLRFEHNEGVNSTDAYGTAPGATFGAVTPGVKAENDEDLFSYRIGAVFKPAPNASIYLAYGNSQTPSQSAVNGSCTATGVTQTCNVNPEEAQNIELGAKWDILDARLSLTGALFRNERTNYRVPSGDPLIPFQVLDGSSRVDGIALGVSGKITDQWSVFANYTYLDSVVLQSVSDAVAAATGDPLKGAPLTNTPEHAFSLYTSYDLPGRVQVGYGLTYQGEYYLTQTTGTALAPVPLVSTEDYLVHRLSVTWQATNKVDLRLNVSNVTDEIYYERGRNNGWATPGAARNAVVTLNYRF